MLPTYPLPIGRPLTLTPELVEKSRELARVGLPIALLSKVIGVDERTCYRWMKEGKEENRPLQTAFRQAILESGPEIARQHLSHISTQAANGSTAAATWMLTHHPQLREHFSDAAAERRAVQKALGQVVTAIETSGLSQEQKTNLFLAMQAQGLGLADTPATDDGSSDAYG